MAFVNKVILLGNLGANPELRYSPSGDCVATIWLATTDYWHDKNGDKKEATQWHRAACFGKLAEVAGSQLKKGMAVYLEGKLTSRRYKDSRDEERTIVEVRVERLQVLGSSQVHEEPVRAGG